MTLRTQLTTDLSVFFDSDEFATAVTFMPSVGAPVSCSVLIYTEDQVEVDAYDSEVLNEIVIAEYRRADIDRDVKRGEKFTVTDSGRVYVVDGIRERDEISIKAIVK